jgi:hypothetical protein
MLSCRLIMKHVKRYHQIQGASSKQVTNFS